MCATPGTGSRISIGTPSGGGRQGASTSPRTPPRTNGSRGFPTARQRPSSSSPATRCDIARDERIERLAIAAGYELGFGGVHGNGSRLALARVPVYLWDVGSVPLGLREDGFGRLSRTISHVANQCAVGTSVMLGLR